jgi:hypothetical protein
MLITESSYDLKLYEDSKDKSLKIVGIFSSANVENNNKRRYKKDLLEREITKVNEKIKAKCLFGELSHPTNPEINPERISHIVESLEWKDDHVYGKAKILSTPFGDIAKTLIKEGNIGISSRGLGTVNEEGFVNEDFNLITYDIVLDASNPGSKFVNGILENENFGPEKVLTLEEAKEHYRKHLWQVLTKIESNM